jgi:hypothetical protein
VGKIDGLGNGPLALVAIIPVNVLAQAGTAELSNPQFPLDEILMGFFVIFAL